MDIRSKAIFQSGKHEFENAEPIFIPRGAAGDPGDRPEITNNAQIYWIPRGYDQWLQLKCTNLTVLGKRMAEVVSDMRCSANQLVVVERRESAHQSEKCRQSKGNCRYFAQGGQSFTFRFKPTYVLFTGDFCQGYHENLFRGNC